MKLERFRRQFYARQWQRSLLISLLSMLLLIGLSRFSPSLVNAEVAVPISISSISISSIPISSIPTSSISTPLSTQGATIIDATQQPVLLRGVNWFGIETDLQVPHGLWLRDYKEMLSQIKQLGYNVIRLPYSVQALRSNQISGVDFSLGSNRAMQGKTPLEVMDLVIQEAQRQGLLILLDSHRLNNQRIPELWYGDGFTEEDWISTWKMLATRYRHQPNVIGADLKNEPHGRASWGTGDRATDWRLAAERAGNAILSVNPDWLIVVEGVQDHVPGQQLVGHWQGGNLEGVKNYPVRLSNPGKLVYSPHEYGPGVFNQPWFSEPTFPQNLTRRWEVGFNYIATQRIAPILIGEFGGRQVDDQSKEGIWQRQLVNYIAQNRLSFSYWSWNPNSVDTGGILNDDWRSIDLPKQQLLNPLLRVTSTSLPTPSPTPSPLPSPSPRPSPSPSPSPTSIPPTPSSQGSASDSGLTVSFGIQSDWQTGFCGSFRIVNQGRVGINNWRLTFEMNQAEIKQSWNGRFTSQQSTYTVMPLGWSQTLQPKQTVDMGFCADKRGADYLPRNVRAIAS
jgi:endoglucanase